MDFSPPSSSMWTSEGDVLMPLSGLQTPAVDSVKTTPFERRFNPYDFNGGYLHYFVEF